MALTDLLGTFGAVMTLVAFAQTDFRRMRFAAIAANLGFIGFGVATPSYPVLALHLILLPLNLQRLLKSGIDATPRRPGATFAGKLGR